MNVPGTSDLVFTWIHQTHRTNRQRELERSEALRHASIVGHQKRRSDSTRCRLRAVRFAECSSSIRFRPPSPLAWTASADRFQGTGYDDGRQTKMIVNFVETAWIPGVYMYASKPTWWRESTPQRVLRQVLYSFVHEKWASGIVLPFLFIIQRVTGSESLANTALRYKHKMLSQLRIELQGTPTDDDLITSVGALFTAATCNNDFIEAKMHGEALRSLLDRKFTAQGLLSFNDEFSFQRAGLLLNFVGRDVELSQCTMSGSLFNVDDWVGSLADLATQSVAAFIAPLEAKFIQELEPGLGDVLQPSCLAIRKRLWLWRQDRPAGLEVDAAVANLYVTGGLSICKLKLNNHLIKIREPLQVSPASERPRLHIEAATTVSLLAYLATFSGNPQFGSVCMWSIAAINATQLYHYLGGFDLASDQLDNPAVVTCDNMMLFSYRVGATLEHGRPSSVAQLPLNWFRTGFVRCVQRMKLTSWAEIAQKVDRFVPSEFAIPPGWTWVDEVLLPHWT